MAGWKTLEQPYAKPRTSSSFVPRRSSRMTANRKVSRLSVQTRNFSRIWHQFAWRRAKSKASEWRGLYTNEHEVPERNKGLTAENAKNAKDARGCFYTNFRYVVCQTEISKF